MIMLLEITGEKKCFGKSCGCKPHLGFGWAREHYRGRGNPFPKAHMHQTAGSALAGEGAEQMTHKLLQ